MPVDQITFQVLQSRLSGIVQEMQDNIFRTGYSTIIRESQDASCMILNAAGDVVGENVVLPLHVSALPEVVRGILRDYGEDIHPLDAFLTNHPYLAGVTHSIDMAVVTPVFHDSRLVAFCASIAHKSDLGGMVPGTGSSSAREIFQEGVQYPPVRYMSRGTVVKEVEAILRANSRTPDLIMGDIRGQVGTARLGEQRLAALMDRYGVETVTATFAEAETKTEERVRHAIAGWSDGEFEGEAFVDNDGIALDRMIHYHVRIKKTGNRILFDFSKSSDQTLGPLNILPPVVRGCCYFAMTAMIDPGLPKNGGLARVVEMKFREGSVLSPRFPAPTNTYMASATAVTEALLQALSRLVPNRQTAGTGGVGGIMIGGKHSNGKPFVQYEVIGSAYGARTGKDGVSGTSVLLDNARTAPIEVLEAEFPTRVRRFELIQDSGGPGRFRGGLGIRREYEILAPEAQFNLRGGKHSIPAHGIDGGAPGRVGACIVNPRTEKEKRMPGRFAGLYLGPGDVVCLEKSGGGGLGDPAHRPFEQIVGDVLDGYVSIDAAVNDYGADRLELQRAVTSAASQKGTR
jgi:N-methylhydantoinase B